ncbi:papain-like cysteine protease family protein [Aquimarina sp. 2201CG14-23]|nr:papain-like cysteine protease family protein [Aquimarina sp. 2201CG14-23]
MLKKILSSTLIIVAASFFGTKLYKGNSNNESSIYIEESSSNSLASNIRKELPNINNGSLNNDTVISFYKFTKMRYESQPPKSQWCWAACLSQMIKGLDASSSIGKEMCDLVQHYGQYYEFNRRTLRSNEKCCGLDTSKKCDSLSIQTEHIKEVFLKGGFECDTVNNYLDKLKSYEFIRKTLIDNDSPIILKTNNGSGPHLEMISGFGKKNNTEYVFISNPLKEYKEKYYPIDCFYSNYKNKIKEMWVSKLKSNENHSKNLNPDKDLIEVHNTINKIIVKEKNENNENWNQNFDNPFLFLKAYSLLKTPITLDQDPNTEIKNRKDIIFNSVQTDTIEDCSNSILEMWQLGGLTSSSVGEITVLTEKIINNDYDFNIIPNDQIYLDNYAITLRKRIKNEKIQLKPISFPSDYQIESKWVSPEELNLRLESLNKIKSFKN